MAHGLSGDIPAWYKLSFGGNSLSVVVHRLAVSTVKETCQPLSEGYQDMMKLPKSFTSVNDKGPWGFSEVVQTQEGPTTDWLIYQMLLPNQRQDKSIDWDKVHASAATLEVLFNCLNLYDGETNSPASQLMELHSDLSTPGDRHAAEFSAIFRPVLLGWINDNAQSGKKQRLIEKSMKRAYDEMWKSGRSSYARNEFQARLYSPGRLNLSIPSAPGEVVVSIRKIKTHLLMPAGLLEWGHTTQTTPSDN